MTITPNLLLTQIHELLPHTQCGLCDYAGCKPYAEAIVAGVANINQCVPGGQPTTDAIATLMNTPTIDVRPSQWPVSPITNKPIQMLAVIRESECIGCTKCIDACPVDAIVGGAKHMHTVIDDFCTGCELCLYPCPVDCIDLIEHSIQPTLADEDYRLDLKLRFEQKMQREHIAHYNPALFRKPTVQAKLNDNTETKPQAVQQTINLGDAQQILAAAKLRSQLKKLQAKLSICSESQKSDIATQIEQIQQQLKNLTP